MAKGKRKRANEAKLRVIAGGAAPKAVVTKRAPASSSPSADARPRVGRPNIRREVEAKRAAEVDDDASIDSRESAVAEVARERKSPFPRALIYGGLVVALGGAAWAITRGSTEPSSTVPSATTPTSVESPSLVPSVNVVPPPVETVAEPPAASVSPSASAPVSASATAAPSAAIPAIPASAPTPAPAVASTPAPAVASTPAPAVAPKPPAPPPPPPPAPKPKPVDDDPYQ